MHYIPFSDITLNSKTLVLNSFRKDSALIFHIQRVYYILNINTCQGVYPPLY